MKELFPEIVDIDFTATMEKQLDAVDSGKNDWVDTLENFYKGFSVTLENAEKSSGGEKIVVPDEVSDVVCELCGRNMVIKTGRYGKFLACPGYPDCKNTKKIVKETGGICPKCGGKIISKKSKKNRVFFGCSNYPKCDFVTWNEPSGEVCPQCGKTLFKKKGKNGGLFCMTEGCGYTAEGKSAEAKE
jgi:DNA topoisomerase-1